MKKKTKKQTTKTSMSYASRPICQEAECIGKVSAADGEGNEKAGKNGLTNSSRTTRSTMAFGQKDACRDKECIGET